MRTVLIFAVLLAAVPPAWAGWGGCAFRAPRNLDLATDGVNTLVVQAAAGELTIRGESGQTQVQVRGTACAGTEAALAEIKLVQRREGDRLIVAVEIPETAGGWFDDQRSLDLELRVPARLALDVADSSGDTTIEGVAALQVQDSSGDLRIERIAGEVSVTDSSGDLDLREIGALHIPSDSSGDITAVGVRGDAVIDTDSSGSVTLREVSGDARVGVDSSGDLRFADIGGGVSVGTDSSGDIIAEGVARDFVVERDGSGDIEHSDVRGAVRVPAD